jgi:hypothetical protein
MSLPEVVAEQAHPQQRVDVEIEDEALVVEGADLLGKLRERRRPRATGEGEPDGSACTEELTARERGPSGLPGQMIPNSRPTFARAVSARSRCSRVCVAM